MAQYIISVKCDNCGNSLEISKEEAADIIHKGLSAARKPINHMFKKMYYPVALCSKCDNEFLIDENMVFKRGISND